MNAEKIFEHCQFLLFSDMLIISSFNHTCKM
jgi:hypothetical protein